MQENLTESSFNKLTNTPSGIKRHRAASSPEITGPERRQNGLQALWNLNWKTLCQNLKKTKSGVQKNNHFDVFRKDIKEVTENQPLRKTNVTIMSRKGWKKCGEKSYRFRIEIR